MRVIGWANLAVRGLKKARLWEGKTQAARRKGFMLMHVRAVMEHMRLHRSVMNEKGSTQTLDYDH